MRKKCLFLTILLLGFQLGWIEPSWPTELDDYNKRLVTTLKDLQQTIIEKIEYDADTTATAFADAENIDRDLRLKDIFRTPLVIIQETINTIGSLLHVKNHIKNIKQLFLSSETYLQIVSGIMTISTLKQIGEDLQLAIDGPTYSSNIEEMLDKAYRRSSTRLWFNPDAYKTVINDYLYAQYEPGPLRIPHKSTNLTRRNFDIASGTYEIERSIREKFRALRDKLEDNPLSSGSALEAINQIEKIKRAIMASKGSYQKLSYETYLKDETGSYVPNTIDVRLGSIADLEKVRQIAFQNLDKELMMQQITTISRATTAGIQATTLYIHTTYKSPKTGEVLGKVQKWSLVPQMAEFGISKVFDTNAREQVNMIPQEMMMTLPLEFSNVWMVADDTASYIEYLIETEKEQPPEEVSRGIPAEIRLQDKSIVKGEIQQEKIKIKTKYGEMNIPVENFISIIGQLIELKDGTTLKGNFADKTLNIETDYGRLKVETKDIDFITFAEEGKPPIKEPLPPHKEKIPIPEFHGVYLVTDDKLIQLKKNATLKTYLTISGEGEVGIRLLSGINVQDNQPYIILYDPLSALLVGKEQYVARLYLSRLRYIGRDSPIQVGGETWANIWVEETPLPFKTAPVEGKKDMYRLIPVGTLPPGVYALFILTSLFPLKIQAFDFSVNFDEYKQSVSPLPNVFAFTWYTETGEKMYGGMMLCLEADTAKLSARISLKEVITKNINRIKCRLKAFEDPIAENIFIYRQGDTRILIQIQTIRGFRNPQKLLDLIGKTGHLEFKLVDEKEDINKALQGELPSGDEILYNSEGTPYLVKKETLLHEEMVEDAEVKIDQQNQPHVVVKFNPEGTDRLSEITAKHKGERLAIILDNVIKSAPVIRTRISSGHLLIQANLTEEETQDLVTIIKSGSLGVPANIIQNTWWGGDVASDFSRGWVFHVKFENPVPSFRNLRQALNSKGMRWCIIQMYGRKKENLYMIWVDLRGITAEIEEEAERRAKSLLEELGLTQPIAPSVQQYLKRQGLGQALSDRIEAILKDRKGQIRSVNKIELVGELERKVGKKSSAEKKQKEEPKVKSEVALEEASLFSSPEKTIQTFFNAILNRNPNLASRCMTKKFWNALRLEIEDEGETAKKDLQNWRITEKELINDSYALIKIESPKLILWNVLKKHKGKWQIVVLEDNIERLPKLHKEIYQEPLPRQVNELLQKIEAEKKVKVGMVKGRAVDALSGDPVWKIRIVVDGKSTIKYKSRPYRLTGIEPGSYTLKASAPNYYDFTKAIKVETGENIVDIPMKGKEIPDLHSIMVFAQPEEKGIQLEIRFINSKGEGITKFPCLPLDLEGKLYVRLGSEGNYTRGKELFSGPIELFWDSEAFLAKNKGIIPWEKIGAHLEVQKYGILDVVLHTPQGDFKDTVDDVNLYSHI